MRFALQTDFAFRTLIYLAVHNRRATVDEIAAFYGISAAHVAKVVNQLGRLGYLRNVRGIGGGVELRREPAEISVGELVLAFEGNMHLLECVNTDNLCVIQPYCKLRSVLAEAERIQMDYLNGVTLKDVLPRQGQARQVGLAGQDR